MSVLAPASECRMRRSALGSTEIGVAALLSAPDPSPDDPYNTAGTRPPRRVRRASFFPNESRAVASSNASIVFAPDLSTLVGRPFQGRRTADLKGPRYTRETGLHKQ